MNGFTLAEGKPLRIGLVNKEPSSNPAMGIPPSLDDIETGGLSMTAQSRAQLMAKLSREPVSSTSAPAPAPAQPTNPTRTVLLKNMFDPEEETEPTWAEDIQEDVSEECSKFGPVLHCNVEKNSKVLLLYLSDSRTPTNSNLLLSRGTSILSFRQLPLLNQRTGL